ncbi:uncharacterized protein TNCV_765591 [Trichonephila clavipes]|nr:uncharacterized protein TNCV_765591 [Trichonephila clavipes]
MKNLVYGTLFPIIEDLIVRISVLQLLGGYTTYHESSRICIVADVASVESKIRILMPPRIHQVKMKMYIKSIDAQVPHVGMCHRCGTAVAEWYRYRTVACFVTGSRPAPLETRRVGQLCTLNLSRAETSSRWCGVVVRRGGASSGVVHVT